MNLIDNEYLIPIFIGRSKQNVKIAKKIRKAVGIRSHLFTEKPSIGERLVFRCHRVDPMRPDFLMMSLQSFSDQLEEYFCPVIVVTDRLAKDLLCTIRESIEPLFVITDDEKLFESC